MGTTYNNILDMKTHISRNKISKLKVKPYYIIGVEFYHINPYKISFKTLNKMLYTYNRSEVVYYINL